DSQTGEPLPGATVLLVGTSMGAATDLNGNFTIRDVPPGEYKLRTTYVGYLTKEVPVKVESDLVSKVTVKLAAVALKGKEVIVTAQASGQSGAINQQLSSSTIENVVSAARIQELPDANAAESVGRLPGISLIRQGGQATQVVIRGLAPQYNMITVDGVQMPGNVTTLNDVGTIQTSGAGSSDLASAYSSGDRGVNLSMISSSMLGGIEVYKAITPDMDAAVLGGVVNFNLREATTRKAQVHLLAQGGYDNLKNTYNDYKFVGTFEKRFFDDKFGVFAEGDAEQLNLSANTLGASYGLNSPKLNVVNKTYLESMTLSDVPSTQKLYDGTLTMDYQLPQGAIGLMNFFSYGMTNTVTRSESFNLFLGGNNHIYGLQAQEQDLTEATSILDYHQQFSALSVHLKLSNTFSQNRQPYVDTWNFYQGLPTGFSSIADASLSPKQIPALALDSLQITTLDLLKQEANILRQDDMGAQLDLETNINFSNYVTSVLKFGGAFRYTNRSFNSVQGDGNVIPSGANVVAGIAQQFPYMRSTINEWGAILPLFADNSYSYGSNFLGGGYKMGLPLDLGLMEQVLNIAKRTGTLESWSPDATQSGINNYWGQEFRSAGYGMITMHIGPDLTFLPGVRYQVLQTEYGAPRALAQLGPASRYQFAHYDTTMNITHGFWLPMVHLIYSPTPWFQIHLAYTNTINYPDYTDITPELDVGTSSVDYHNYLLKPATSANYDAIFSFYDNTIGLLSVDGFYKRISNFIFATGTTYVINAAQYPGVPSYADGYSLTTAINDQYPVYDYGAEVDWQTHFWYLPGPLSGLVLNVNYTHVYSKATYPYTYLNTVKPTYPVIIDTVVTSFSDRLLDQPNDIVNITLGYDLGGFGARVGMTYNGNIYQAYNFWPQLRGDASQYLSWDAQVKQDLPWSGLQIYLDLQNINGEPYLYTNQGTSFPSSEQYYGMTADLGVRMQL
ncbi:MAG: TonB-dependent receptor, partial [Bacteroidetes bacterium]|nr:TonB-dependent receptor [Bacteroidota bacterium]